jgi:hypothetical protein
MTAPLSKEILSVVLRRVYMVNEWSIGTIITGDERKDENSVII